MFALHTLHRTPRLEARHTRTAPPARGARRTTRNGAEHARYLTKAFMLLCITGRLLSPGLDNLTGNSTGTRQELDSSTPRRMVPASTSLEHRLGRNSRQELDTELARQARPRQRLDSVPRQRLDSASTAPRRSLDSSTARQPGLKAARVRLGRRGRSATAADIGAMCAELTRTHVNTLIESLIRPSAPNTIGNSTLALQALEPATLVTRWVSHSCMTQGFEPIVI